MTRPSEVLVQVADLEIVVPDLHGSLASDSSAQAEYVEARKRLRAAIPEPEWELTDEMRQRVRRAYDTVHGAVSDGDDSAYFDLWLRALHREGLIP